MKRWFALGGALAAWWPVAARAEPLERGALRLEWTAPGGCPNAVEVVERVEALLGARIAELTPEPLRARGKVSAIEPLRFELELETEQRAQRFTRTMQAPSCAELSDAGALVLALAIDPTLVERKARALEEQPPAPSEELPPPPPLAPPEPAVVPAIRTPDPRPRSDAEVPLAPGRSPIPEWSARMAVILDLGTVADTAFGPRIGGGRRFGAARLELALVWLPPARTVIAENPERGGEIDLVAGDVSGCLLPFRGKLAWSACVDMEIGRIHGAGFGTVTESEGSALWFGAGISASGRLKTTSSLSLVASAGVLFAPQAHEFTLQNVGVVHEMSDFVGRFGLGLETEFW